MNRVLIIEDETPAAKTLQKLLQEMPEHLPVRVEACLTSLAQTRAWLQTQPPPDLVFLDIQLSDGTGFELFEQNDLHCPVIFTTAYHEYALRAFKVNSLDYLLKPLKKSELEFALSKWKQQYRFNEDQTEYSLKKRMENLMRQLMSGPSEKHYKERFLVPHKTGFVPVASKEIACFHKDELIFIHTLDGKRYVSEQHSLDETEELLDPSLFFRANRQYIVSVDNIAEMKSTYKGAQILLKQPKNTLIDLSREKVQTFKNWLGG